MVALDEDALSGTHESMGSGYVTIKPLLRALEAKEKVTCAVALDDEHVSAGVVHLNLTWEPDPLNMFGRPGQLHLMLSWTPCSGVYLESPEEDAPTTPSKPKARRASTPGSTPAKQTTPMSAKAAAPADADCGGRVRPQP